MGDSGTRNDSRSQALPKPQLPWIDGRKQRGGGARETRQLEGGPVVRGPRVEGTSSGGTSEAAGKALLRGHHSTTGQHQLGFIVYETNKKYTVRSLKQRKYAKNNSIQCRFHSYF